jgi:hypothetical protein
MSPFAAASNHGPTDPVTSRGPAPNGRASVEMSLAGRLVAAANSRGKRRKLGRVIKTLAPLLPRSAPPVAPIFVLGSPRSGTTMVFTILAASASVNGLAGEGHFLWDLYHGENEHGWESQATRPDEIATHERRALRWTIAQLADGRTYLDKTPRNSLQVPYLHTLFPDARFVVLIRDGRAVVSSLINGWRDTGGMFPGRVMPVPIAIDGYAGERWKFLAPPGWESYATGHTLEEVCAFQWVSCMEALLAARAQIDPDRWVEVRYEGFTADPVKEASRLLRALRLDDDPMVLHAARSLDARVTKAISAPRPDKWRDENPDEIERIVPMIAPTMSRLGYEL